MSKTSDFRNVEPTVSAPRSRLIARDIDWRAIEYDYRLGLFSLRELAAKYGCAHSTIANYAGRHGWLRRPLPVGGVDIRLPVEQPGTALGGFK
jgi:hypothetical protein